MSRREDGRRLLVVGFNRSGGGDGDTARLEWRAADWSVTGGAPNPLIAPLVPAHAGTRSPGAAQEHTTLGGGAPVPPPSVPVSRRSRPAGDPPPASGTASPPAPGPRRATRRRGGGSRSSWAPSGAQPYDVGPS